MNSEIERMAKEAELADEFGRPLPAYPRRLAKFAALLAEECAKLAHETDGFDEYEAGRGSGQEEMAQAIRVKFALSDGEDAAR